MTTRLHQLRLAGTPDDLFSHMVLWGLAVICEDAGIRGVRGSWTEDVEVAPMLWAEASAEEVARAVLAHAQTRAAADSWLRETFTFHDAKKKPITVASMAPRTANPVTDDDWRRLDEEVKRIRSALPSLLDERLLQGLGQRSWWVVEGSGMRPDRGCSTWEMRTRNQGTDIVRDRLLPLAEEVVRWSPERIIAGLTGLTCVDVVGNNAPNSRTATGFRLPGPVDNVRAWCALWALSLLPVLPLRKLGTHTPAVAPRNSVRGSSLHHLLMVMPAEPMPLARFVRLQGSAQIVIAAADAADGANVSAQRVVALRWLRARGATALLRFPVRKVGSDSAPERQTLAGTVVVA